MKISLIQIKNFRGIDDMQFNPEHINVFLGKNGSGKTSILNAINFALTGEMKSEYLKNGARSTKVIITFEDGTSIERKQVKSGGVTCKVNEKNTTAKSTKEFLEEKLGTSLETYKAMIGIDYLTELTQKDLSKFFLNILPIQMSFDKMMDFVKEICNEKYNRDLQNEEKEYLSTLFKEMIDEKKSFRLDYVKSVFDKVYSDRRELNAIIKNLTAKSIFDKETLPSESKENLKQALYDLISEESLSKEYDKKLLNYQNSLSARKKAEETIKELTETIKLYDSVKAPDEKMHQDAVTKKRTWEDNKKRSLDAIAIFQANAGLFQKQLDNLNSNMCPLSNKLVCRTDKTGIKNELSIAVKDNLSKAQQHRDFIEKCDTYITQLENWMHGYQKNEIAWNKKMMLEKQIKDFVLPIIPEKPVEVKKEKNYAVEKELINRKLAIYTQFEEAEKNTAELKMRQKELILMEFALLVLDAKTGVPAKLLKFVLGNLETMCNEQADKIKKGMSLKFNCENGFEVLAETQAGKGFLPISTVSNGEKLIVVYLLLSIVNQITNAKYLVIDNLDKLDETNTKAFLDLLNQDAEFEHIFIGAVNHPDTKKVFETMSANLTIM